MNNLGVYCPGKTWLHQLPAAVKLLALLLLGISTWWLNRFWWPPVIVMAVLIVTYLSAGLGIKMWWRQLQPASLILIFTFIANSFTFTPLRSVAIVLTLSVLISAAALVTLTTKTTELMNVILVLSRPFSRFGVNSERIGLGLVLGLRAVPLVAGLARQVKQAQDCRGVRSWRAFAVPLVVAALREADALGEALIARGVDD